MHACEAPSLCCRCESHVHCCLFDSSVFACNIIPRCRVMCVCVQFPCLHVKEHHCVTDMKCMCIAVFSIPVCVHGTQCHCVTGARMGTHTASPATQNGSYTSGVLRHPLLLFRCPAIQASPPPPCCRWGSSNVDAPHPELVPVVSICSHVCVTSSDTEDAHVCVSFLYNFFLS